MLLREFVRDHLGLYLCVDFSLGGRETGQEV